MKRFTKFLTLILITFLIACTCSACVPFIDGVVEAKDYFEENVQCQTYTVNSEAANGFIIVDGDNLSLTDLTDSNEKNTVMQYYYSFTFKVQNENLNLQTVAFIIEAQDDVIISFRLENGAAKFNKTVNLNAGKIEIVEFTALNLELAAYSDLKIILENPIFVNLPYRIDTVLFIV